MSHLTLAAVCSAALTVPAGSLAVLTIGSGTLAAASAGCTQQPASSASPNASSEPAAATSFELSPTPEVAPCPVDRLGGSPIGLVAGATPPISGQAGSAVAAAIEAVSRGGRYVAEGNGPVDFDCSGLTAFAWRTAGVQLVDYSYTQWNQTARITRDQLMPGDLVFWFGGDVHHVAIVIAVDGDRVTIAEAANPTDGVRIRTLGGAWDETYLSGYGRVLA